MAKDTIGNEITNKAFEYIDAIASNLGVATEYVFTALVRQQLAEGIAWLIISVSLIVGGAFAVKFFFRSISGKVNEILEKKSGWYTLSDTEDFILTSRWIVLIIYVITVMITIFTLPHNITQVINPEYHAIMEIIEAITGGSSE